MFGYSWQTWILYAPQYHALMLVLCLTVIALLVRVNRRLKSLQKDKYKDSARSNCVRVFRARPRVLS